MLSNLQMFCNSSIWYEPDFESIIRIILIIFRYRLNYLIWWKDDQIIYIQLCFTWNYKTTGCLSSNVSKLNDIYVIVFSKFTWSNKNIISQWLMCRCLPMKHQAIYKTDQKCTTVHYNSSCCFHNSTRKMKHLSWCVE